MGEFDKAMLGFVKTYPVMQSAPAWMLLADEENKTLVFERDNLVFVFNWGTESIPNYEIPVRQTGDYRIVFSSDEQRFGGFGNINNETVFPSERQEDQIVMKIYNVSRTAVVYSPI